MSMTYNLRSRQSRTPDLTGIIRQIKDRVSIMEAAKALDLQQKLSLQQTGMSLQGNCPTGHPSTGHHCFSLDLTDHFYHCFSCGESGDIVALVMLVNGIGVFEAVKWLADQFTPDLKQPLDESLENLPEEVKRKHEQADLYRLIYQEGKRQLYLPIGKIALDYLTQGRGYDPIKLQSTEWIFWDSEANIRSYLSSKAPNQTEHIDQLPLLGAFGDKFRLALPFRDRHGTITGFLKRAHEKAGFDIRDTKGVRWDSTKGLTKPDLFGLNRIRKQEELVVVEGYPDAAYLPALGLDNIVAFGQAAFSEKYIEGLRALGIKRIILALDNDNAGLKNSEEICRLLAESNIQVFVLDPPTMSPHKDPDEYVAAHGIDSFRKLIETSERSSMWLTKRIFAITDISSDLGRARAISGALEFAGTIQNPLEAQAVVDTIRTQLSLTPEMLDIYYRQVLENASRKHIQESIQNVTRDSQRMAKEGKLEPALRNLTLTAKQMLVEYAQVGMEPEKPFSAFLASKRASDSQRIPGQRLGLELKQFPTIDSAMCGIQPSMIALAADPNTGKTILTVNLAVDILQSNPGASVLFYSMDDTRDAIVGRFVAKLTDLPINDVQRKPKGAAEEKAIGDAYKWMSERAEENRLNVREIVEGMTIASISEAVHTHPNRESLIVIIDGMYNIPMDGRYSSIREENIDRANRVKELTKLYKVPVIVTAELRKRPVDDSKRKERTLHDIMETGKYAYNADVVCLLTPQDPDKYCTQPEPIVELEIAKNKLSSFRGKIELTFKKETATFRETSGSNPYSFGQGI